MAINTALRKFGRPPRSHVASRSEPLAIGEVESSVFNCPRCARPLAQRRQRLSRLRDAAHRRRPSQARDRVPGRRARSPARCWAAARCSSPVAASRRFPPPTDGSAVVPGSNAGAATGASAAPVLPADVGDPVPGRLGASPGRGHQRPPVWLRRRARPRARRRRSTKGIDIARILRADVRGRPVRRRHRAVRSRRGPRRPTCRPTSARSTRRSATPPRPASRRPSPNERPTRRPASGWPSSSRRCRPSTLDPPRSSPPPGSPRSRPSQRLTPRSSAPPYPVNSTYASPPSRTPPRVAVTTCEPFPIDDAGRGPRIEFLVGDRRAQRDRQVLGRDRDRPAGRVVGAGRRARPAVRDLDRERVAGRDGGPSRPGPRACRRPADSCRRRRARARG